MSSPKYIPPPNYTQVPNALFGLIGEMSEAELKVVLILLRETFGWQRASHRLTIGQLQSMTQLSETSVRKGIRAAIDRGILSRTLGDDGVFIYALIVRERASPPQNLTPSKSDPPAECEGGPPQNLTPQNLTLYQRKKEDRERKRERKNPPLPPGEQPTDRGGEIENERTENRTAPTHEEHSSSDSELAPEVLELYERLQRIKGAPG